MNFIYRNVNLKKIEKGKKVLNKLIGKRAIFLDGVANKSQNDESITIYFEILKKQYINKFMGNIKKMQMPDVFDRQQIGFLQVGKYVIYLTKIFGQSCDYQKKNTTSWCHFQVKICVKAVHDITNCQFGQNMCLNRFHFYLKIIQFLL